MGACVGTMGFQPPGHFAPRQGDTAGGNNIGSVLIKYTAINYIHRIEETQAIYKMPAGGGTLASTNNQNSISSTTSTLKPLRKEMPASAVAASSPKILPAAGDGGFMPTTPEIRVAPSKMAHPLDTSKELKAQYLSLQKSLTRPLSRMNSTLQLIPNSGRNKKADNNLSLPSFGGGGSYIISQQQEHNNSHSYKVRKDSSGFNPIESSSGSSSGDSSCSGSICRVQQQQQQQEMEEDGENPDCLYPRSEVAGAPSRRRSSSDARLRNAPSNGGMTMTQDALATENRAVGFDKLLERGNRCKYTSRNSHDYGITAAEVPERKELLSANPRDKKNTFHHCLDNLKGQDSFERDLNIEFFEDEGKFIVRKRASLTDDVLKELNAACLALARELGFENDQPQQQQQQLHQQLSEELNPSSQKLQSPTPNVSAVFTFPKAERASPKYQRHPTQ